MKKHFISMAVTATILASCGGAKQQLPRQINLIIQWNNLQTYKYCGTRFPNSKP